MRRTGMSMPDDHRLIGKCLPIEDISREASREKNVRKRHTLTLWRGRSGLHTARKPGVVRVVSRRRSDPRCVAGASDRF